MDKLKNSIIKLIADISEQSGNELSITRPSIYENWKNADESSDIKGLRAVYMELTIIARGKK